MTLERTDPQHAGQRETVRARYVVGCDGARSATRAAIGRELVGEAAHQAWGVMDVLALTDFPDVRYKVAIQSGAKAACSSFRARAAISRGSTSRWTSWAKTNAWRSARSRSRS